MTPSSPLHAALLLLGRLHADRDDQGTRARLAGLVDRLGAKDRAYAEMVARAFCKTPHWHSTLQPEADDMPDTDKPVKNVPSSFIRMILALLFKGAFGEEGGTLRASGPLTLESLSAEIDAIPEGTEFSLSALAPGNVGGPVTDSLITSLFDRLAEFAKSQVDLFRPEVEALVAKLAAKISFLP